MAISGNRVVDRTADLTGFWIGNVPEQILSDDGTVQIVEAKYETVFPQVFPPQQYMRLRVSGP